MALYPGKKQKNNKKKGGKKKSPKMPKSKETLTPGSNTGKPSL